MRKINKEMRIINAAENGLIKKTQCCQTKYMPILK